MNSRIKSCAICQAHFVFPEMAILVLDEADCLIPICSEQCATIYKALQKKNHVNTGIDGSHLFEAAMDSNRPSLRLFQTFHARNSSPQKTIR